MSDEHPVPYVIHSASEVFRGKLLLLFLTYEVVQIP